MSLFNFTFRKIISDTRNGCQASDKLFPDYLPKQVESGLGREEHNLVTTAVQNLAIQSPIQKGEKQEKNVQDILTSNVHQ